jgi:uncharacterized membrane protein YeaQ/YmgE (transglycosylase-associated protein family)
MSFLWIVATGVAAGAAFKVMSSQTGFPQLLVLGVTGAVLAAGLGWAEHWYQPGQPMSYVASGIGALSLLVLYRLTKREQVQERRGLRRVA